ncbi:jouberin isoform X2 [Pseudophryne corroboree]|uniref:jouberin isoform X2 n=1 Tax=Pseudophryne corroboree TaxID=495146 RepID=UPI003081B9A4
MNKTGSSDLALKMPAESEAKARTKAHFDEIFQRYVALSEIKKKSKKRPPPQEHVLETFNNQLHLAKDTAHEALTNNTYNTAEESPMFTNNKLSEQIQGSQKESNVTFIEHKEPRAEKRRKKRLQEIQRPNPTEPQKLDNSNTSYLEGQQLKSVTKKIRTILTEESSPADFDDEDQLIEAYRLQVSQEETNEIKEKIKKKLKAHLSEHFSKDENEYALLNNDKEKKKRKKKRDLVKLEAETSVMSLSELQAPPAEIRDQSPSQAFLNNTVKQEDDLPRVKGKKTKKTARADDVTKADAGEDGENRSIARHVYDDSLMLGVHIHRADKLKTNIMTSRPMVKIHIMDQQTGDYVKKENSTDAASSFSEQGRHECVLPKLTQPYEFKRFKTLVPEWEEQIIFNERFTRFLNMKEDGPNVIIFFEILDLINEDNTITNTDNQIKERGFQTIAWAFLKLVGANDVLNVDKKLRLQLYYPPARVTFSTNVYEWWLKYSRNRYSSTLYVTIKGLKLPDNVNIISDMGSRNTDLQNEDTLKDSESNEFKQRKEHFQWTRLPGQACRIPNRRFLSLQAGQMGCFSVRFAHDGRTLAAACADRDGYPVYLYEIPSGQYLRELHGHLSSVYDLCWSKDDEHLLSASSDCTVRLWRIGNGSSSASKVLPHPSFVYTAKLHPMSDYLAVTGCYDAVIRVWNVKVKEINGQLVQEFDGHKSFINSLCFDADGKYMFSGDSSGLIIMWNTEISRSSQQNPVELWTVLKEVKESDMKGIAVNHLQVHPNGRRLLIHTKDSTLRIMDLRILAAKKYIGATNYRDKLHSSFTPCGTFVMAGSEDGVAYVWNAETGDQVAKYSELSYTAPLRDVAFHPHEHMVAFCAFGQSQPILIYIYDVKVAQLEAESVQTSSDVSDPVHSDSLTFQASAIAARSSMRLMKVKQKLDSVLTGSNVLQPAPSLLSPHAKLRLTGAPSPQLQTSGTSPLGGFSPVGLTVGRTPSIRLQMDNTETKVSSLTIEADRVLPIQETVVALYDYTAHRSDELSIHRSDIIHVLYKDNDNWWFGSIQNGQQGYFPANYVAAEYHNEDDNPSASKSQYFGSRSLEHSQAEQSEHSPHWMSAVPSKSKDQKLMSQHDTDVGSPVPPGKIQKIWQMTEPPDISSPRVALQTGPSTSVESGLNKQESDVKQKKKKGYKEIIAVGKTNTAFEPDV